MYHVKDDGSFELSKAEVKALTAFASRDTTRPHLVCVYFDPPEGCAVATDGSTLIKAQNCGRSAGVAGFSVPREALAQASKLLRQSDVLNVRQIDSGAVLLAARDRVGRPLGAIETPTADGKFPTYDSAIPKHGPNGQVAAEASPVGLDAEYLARLLLVQKAADAKGLVLMPGAVKTHGPVLATVDDPATGTTWTAIIMPRRI